MSAPPKTLPTRLGELLGWAGLTLALFNAVFAQPPFAIGVMRDVEMPIVALHFGAALCALSLACSAMAGGDAPSLGQPPVFLALVLGVWTAVVAPFSPLPWLSILGAPQNAEGALLFIDLAVFIATALHFARRLGGRRWLAGGVLAASWLAGAVQLIPAAQPEFFPEYLAYFGLASSVVAYAWLPRLVWRFDSRVRLPRWLQAAVLGGPVLLVSANRTAIGLALLSLAVLALANARDLWRSPAALKHLRRSGILCAALLPVVVFAALTWLGHDAPIESIRSRARIAQVLTGIFSEHPLTWLIGTGWGETSTLFATHLTATSAVLWQDSWDAARRDIFHSHNDVLEALIAIGLPGAIAMLGLLAAPVIAAPRRLLGVAIFYSVSLAGLAALWFQMPFSVAIMALGYAAVLPRARRRRITLETAGVLAVGLLQAAAAIFLLSFSLGVRASIAEDGLPRAPGRNCASFPAESWRGNLSLASLFAGSYQKLGKAIADGSSVELGPYDRLAALFCEVDRRAAAGDSPYLLLVSVVFRGELAFGTAWSESRSRVPEAFETWRPRLWSFLDVAPLRSDVAVHYLGWLLERHDPSARRESERLLARNPSDPVGLWFSGAAILQDRATATGPDGQIALDRLRQALAKGIDQILPIDPNIKNKITSSK